MPVTPPQDTRHYPDIAPETCIRIVDQTVVDWVRTLRFRDQHPKVVAAWQSRQFAQNHEIDEGELTKQAVSYPVLSVSATGMTPDLNRRIVTNILSLAHTARRWQPNDKGTVELQPPQDSARIYVDETTKEELFLLPFPLPFNFEYQVDIWTKTKQDMRYLQSSLMARFSFTDCMYIKATFPGYGEKLLYTTMSRVDDTSDIEAGEKERLLRSTISITVMGWIFRIPIRRKTLKNLHVVLFDHTGEPEGMEEFYEDVAHYTFGSNGQTITSIDEYPPAVPPNRVLGWLSFVDGADPQVGQNP